MPPVLFHPLRALPNDLKRDGCGGLPRALVWLAAWLVLRPLVHVAAPHTLVKDRAEVESQPQGTPSSVSLTRSQAAQHRRVASGQVWIDRDRASERQRLIQEQARLAGLEEQIQTLRNDLDVDRQAGCIEPQAAGQGDAAAMSRIDPAVAEQECQRAPSAARHTPAAQVDVLRLPRDRDAPQRSEPLRVAARKRELAILVRDHRTTVAAIATIHAEVARHASPAPVAADVDVGIPLGTDALAQVDATPGAPWGGAHVRMDALHQPAAVFGQVASQQRAWMHLSGFPWTQYGRVARGAAHRTDQAREGRSK